MARIAGLSVDLVSPFPADRLDDMHRWLRYSKQIRECGEFPEDLGAFVKSMKEMLPRVSSWGVYRAGSDDLVGVVMFEPVGMMGGKSYIAAARRVWGKGWMEEAARMGLRAVFERYQNIGFIFGVVAESNAAARCFDQRIGMSLKNILRGTPNLLIYEITRESWNRQSLTA